MSLGTEPNSTDLAGAKPVVLVVEDEVLVQMLVLEVLDELGVEALEANDGATALEIIRRTAASWRRPRARCGRA